MAETETQTQDYIRNLTVIRHIWDSVAAAEFDVTVGFTPRYVKAVNVDTGDTMEWYQGMTAGYAVKTTASTGVRTVITTLGITVSGKTITIGLDLDVNVQDEQMVIIAQG